MSRLRFAIVRTEHVNDCPYFIGIWYRLVATIQDSKRCVRQLRFGLIWWHIVVTFHL